MIWPRVRCEDTTVVCSAGVLAATAGLLQLREGTSCGVSLMRLPRGCLQHDVYSLATAQPTTCVLMPSPRHLLAAGATPAQDDPLKTCCSMHQDATS